MPFGGCLVSLGFQIQVLLSKMSTTLTYRKGLMVG